MQTEDFLKGYQTKTDEELIQLAAVPEQLTSEARLALHGELSRRSISIPDNPKVRPPSGDRHDVRRAVASEKLQTGDVQNRGVVDFVAEVLKTYHSHFWLFFKINAPAVIISTIAIITTRNEVRELSRQLLRDLNLAAHRTEILEMQLLNYSAWILSWIASSFVFGATCIAVEECAAGFTASAWRSFLNIRERLAPFLGLSLLLCVLVAVTEAAGAVGNRRVLGTSSMAGTH